MQLLHVITSIEARFHGYQQSGSTNDRPRSGRPRITNHVQDCYIQYPGIPAKEHNCNSISNIPGLRRISAQTVRNRLREHGIRARRPYFGAVLQRQHRRAMVRWCNTVRMWNLVNWRRVWFSDESRFMN